MHNILTTIENEEKLDKPAAKLKDLTQQTLDKLPESRKVQNGLHGVWMNHPLHPVLVTLPLGAWTIAGLVDLLTPWKRRANSSSTMLVGLGLVGAAVAAPAGLADWSQLSRRQQRVGLVHAALNMIAVPFFAMSLLQRLAGGGGKFWSLTGLAIGTASAYLGGDLVYRLGAGVAKTDESEPPEQAILEVDTGSLAEGSLMKAPFGAYDLVVGRHNGTLFALADTCTHLACSLSEGRIEDQTVVCNCHGSAFSIDDGSVRQGPATSPVEAFEVVVTGKMLSVHKKSSG